MKEYSYSINKRLFSFSFVNDTEESHGWDDRNKWSHYPVLHRVLNFMKDRGFEVGRDPEILEYYKVLNEDHWYGRKGDLEFKAGRYPRGFEIKFFQNINFENRCGGEYDFHKFEKAPYLIKLMWINETKKIAEFIESIVPGIKNNTKEDNKLAIDFIKNDYVESCHKPQKDMNFNLSELDGTTCEDNTNNKDRDGKVIYNGDIKYFRDRYTGRLQRGKVYHNINNMWWVILNDTEVTNVADFEFFDLSSGYAKYRRIKMDIKPKEYINKLELLKKLTTKELDRELKRRRKLEKVQKESFK